jgi:acetyl esterase/lipase
MIVHVPKETAHPAPAMLVFRGGAYSISDGSGAGSAEWLTQHGIVGIEVRYRTGGGAARYPAPYADAARAVRLARNGAAGVTIDPERVGVMGYSAGGHLASLLSTQPDLWLDPEDDLTDLVSARPNLVVLGYPVISFVDSYVPGAFARSVENFFGEDDVDESRRKDFSNELHVMAGHPPVFIWTTEEDSLVPHPHSQLFADACRRAGVDVMFKLYPTGAHGIGLALEEATEVRGWTVLLSDWIAKRWGSIPHAR